MALLQLLPMIPLLGVVWFLWDRFRYANYPPGPQRLPFIGNLLQLVWSKNPSVALAQISEKYGEVAHVKIGLVDTICFNGLKTVHDGLAHSKTAAKPHEMMGMSNERNLRQNVGLLWGNGEVWQTTQKFTIRTLREFGFGKSASMNEVINQEYEKFRDWLVAKTHPSTGLVLFQGIFNLSMANILWRLVTGVGYSLEDPKMLKLLSLSERTVEAGNVSFTSLAFPFLWDMFPSWSGKNEVASAFAQLREFILDTIDEHRSRAAYKEQPECYVDAFLKRIEETKSDPNSSYNGGSDTSSNSLAFCVLYMLLHPAIQKGVQAEIQEEVGNCGQITSEMRSSLPFTHATLLECYRFSTILPFPGVRAATEDFHFKGHLIQKGTPLMMNLEGAHFSKSEWGDPQNFRPERFLNHHDGTLNTKLAASLVTFGAGKKKCIGQSLAEASTFIYFASLLRDFSFLPVPGREDRPTTKPRPGLVYAPEPFTVQVKLRGPFQQRAELASGK